MKILISSGGTKVPIDSVRDITNMSKGTFGCNIARDALFRGHDVHYFCATDAVSPRMLTLHLSNPPTVNEQVLLEASDEFQQNSHRYKETIYRTYDEYADRLQRILEEFQPDVTILAAAVSDYVVEPTKGKISSSEEMIIRLRPADKIISHVKQWCPNTFLVGFKLLVDATKTELVEAAMRSINRNGCDLVVANSWPSNRLNPSRHEIFLVEPDGQIEHVTEDLAQTVVQYIEQVV